MTLAAMSFARTAHATQRRKYTNDPYVSHLAEVAGIVATLPAHYYLPLATQREVVATAWLHDVLEDTETEYEPLLMLFGPVVAGGVLLLTDFEEGNRATRKAAARARLADAPAWVQTVKVADLISNTASIRQHDARFAETYIPEAVALLDAMTGAHPDLVTIAREALKCS